MNIQDIIDRAAEEVFAQSEGQYETWNGGLAFHATDGPQRFTEPTPIGNGGLKAAIETMCTQLMDAGADGYACVYTLRDLGYRELVMCCIVCGEDRASMLLRPVRGQDGKVEDFCLIDRIVDEDDDPILELAEPTDPFLAGRESLRIEIATAEAFKKLLQ